VTTELERAVIEAARSFCRAEDGAKESLWTAVQALDAGQDPEVREIGWHEVVEGDRIKSVKTGKFYEVDDTFKFGKEFKISVRTGPDNAVTITRPTEAEPTAFVKRGQTGKAVDVFVEVFSSGETK